MYCDFYRLRERPFNVTADPKFLYLNARYREALASLHYGISQRKGFITLIGEAGTGKTTLLKKLLDDLDATTRTVFIFNTNVSFDEILEYIFGEFDLPVANGKRLYMLQRLNAFLLEELRNGRNVALLIDEAQDLDFSVLEDLRLLSNLETAKEKILQIVLSGQTELGQKLGNPGLRQLRQRVAVNCRLLPLTRDEVSEYIQSRLTAAGSADPKIFSRDAEDRIFEISTGIPRLVNIVCDNALVIGYALGKKRIGADVVNEAAADLLSIQPPSAASAISVSSPQPPLAVEPPAEVAAPVVQTVRRGRSASQLGVVAAVAVAIVLGLFSVGRSLLRRDLVGAEPSAAKQSLEVVAPGSSRTEESAPSFKPPAEPPVAAVQEPAVQEPAADHPAAEPEVAVNDHEGAIDEAREEGGNDLLAEREAEKPLDEKLEAKEREAEAEAERLAAVEPHDVSVEHANKAMAHAVAPEEPVKEVPSVAVDPLAANKRHAVPVPPPLPVPAQGRIEADGEAPGEEAHVAVPAGLVQPAPSNPADVETAQNPDGVKLAMKTYQTVRVQPGETVSEIAVRNYGQASPTILDMMKIANPSIRNIDVISVGQSLELPQLDEGFVVLQQGGGYSLLLMSTPIQQRANEIEAALRQHGFQARVKRADFGSGQTVSRVMVGGLPNRDAALDVGKRLQKLFREDERIAAMAR